MVTVKFFGGDLNPVEQGVVAAGFARHSVDRSAPLYNKERVNWLAYNASNVLVGVLSADVLWDWIYVDELWVDEAHRGKGLGKTLMRQVEEYAHSQKVAGLWLWTQSWQSAEFYQKLGYIEFARFPDFPRGHSRIGFRKVVEPQLMSL